MKNDGVCGIRVFWTKKLAASQHHYTTVSDEISFSLWYMAQVAIQLQNHIFIKNQSDEELLKQILKVAENFENFQ